MKVRDVMSTSIAEIKAEDTCQHAAQVMRDQGVGMLIVTRDARIIDGVLTDRDLVVRCTALGGDPAQQFVGEHMDRHPTTVDADLDLERAVSVMRNAGLRRLPVTTGGSHVTGVLSLDDVALDVKQYLDAFLSVAGQYSHRPHT